ncbi:UNVERIFIED_CONTAM: hypothetical protein K2H54_044774 [Gekko kuhli]
MIGCLDALKTPMMAILPNDEKKWKRNFRFRYLLLSHSSLQMLEAYLLTLSYRDFKNSYEWEKFQVWLQEVLSRAQWLTEGPVEVAGSEPLCACLQRKRPRND